MKKKWRISAAAAVFSMFASSAYAVPIIVSQSQPLTVQGQDMTFLLGPALPPSDGSGGFLTVATGTSAGTPGVDLSGAFAGEDENFELTFDGLSQGFYSCGGSSNNGATAIPGAVDNSFNFNDCSFTLGFALSAGSLATLLADGTVSVGVLFGDDVSTFEQLDQVVVTLRYTSAAVPEPATLGLLGLGFAGLATRRRKR